MDRRTFLAIPALLPVAACSRFPEYNGPEVTRVVVWKNERLMSLFHREEVLESYEIELGFAPEGHKFEYGDGRTPEGEYFIDRRNPNSDFYLSIGISYPNAEDIARAREAGVNPGGDIFIHGTPRPFRNIDDWTVGCIAVRNREMRQIYSMVQNGTPIMIHP
ncbi:murein L,D-transpeptidase family protein [Gymnodinialimonas hymeniacidonis]|uniref:L,D-transpeptidase family protein n=1 Tax=Gymnodinialimonas hymeniacidonis TaxID=3126508 RepID=UPI0034C662E3